MLGCRCMLYNTQRNFRSISIEETGRMDGLRLLGSTHVLVDKQSFIFSLARLLTSDNCGNVIATLMFDP